MSLLPSVVAVVKFKKLAKQLTTAEFDQFLTKIAKHIGKEVVLKLLCSQFIKSTSINNEQLLINNMIIIISNIIQSRKSEAIEPANNGNIDELPSPLIGEISSYLKQKEYSLFSRTNRSIFVSCNTPNTLKRIFLPNIKKYKKIKFQNYPQITYLSCTVRQFNHISMHQESVSNRLQKLRIYYDDSSDDDIQKFINGNHLNLNNLQTVLVNGFKGPFATFFKLLSKFKMVQHLCLSSIGIQDAVNTEEIHHLFPNLTRLTMHNITRSLTISMLTHYGPNLECLSAKLIYGAVNFVKLRRLFVIRPSLNAINGILNKTKVLRETVFAPHSGSKTLLSVDEIKLVIKRIIFEQSGLEFFYIPAKPDNFDAICNAIESALYQTSKRERENLEVVLEIDCCEGNKFDVADFMINISRIVNVLNTSNTNNFMVGFECNDQGEFNVDIMLKAINDYIERTPTVKLMKATKLGFIIGNKECKMHRHHKWWNDFGTIQFYN